MRSNFKIERGGASIRKICECLQGICECLEGIVNNKCPRGDGIVDAFGSMI